MTNLYKVTIPDSEGMGSSTHWMAADGMAKVVDKSPGAIKIERITDKLNLL